MNNTNKMGHDASEEPIHQASSNILPPVYRLFRKKLIIYILIHYSALYVY